MEGEESVADAMEARWTCEACGCHTNTEVDDPISCGVCGTRRAPTLFRRSGHSSARIVHGGFSRGFGQEDDDGDDQEEEDEEDEEDVPLPERHGDEEENEEDGGEEEQMLALEVAGAGESATALRRSSGSAMLRAVAAAGGGSVALSLLGAAGMGDSRDGSRPRPHVSRSRLTPVNPEELLLIATDNAGLYQPGWADPSMTGGRHHGSNSIGAGRSSNLGIVNGIFVDTEGHPNVANLPEGAGEGRAVRSSIPIPRGAYSTAARGSPAGAAGTSSPLASGVASDRSRRRAYGFRVAFDHPGRETGRSMGGCYLVGVTTSSFTAYGERSGLQQSRLFWGIEDGGRRYEGSTSSGASRRRQHHNSSSSTPPSRGVPSSHGMQLGRGEAPRNSDNVLFGSREVITVVADLDSRTLTYWRDGRILGTLVSNLPRAGHLYPVAVPFNAGVSVAITGLDGDPLSALSDYHCAQRRARHEKDELRRRILALQRSTLIRERRPTPELLRVLRTIFSWYAKSNCGSSQSIEEGTEDDCVWLDATSAARLWYRSGMKVSHVRSILEKRSSSGDLGHVTLNDFVNVVTQIVCEEDHTATDGSFNESIDAGSIAMSNVHSGSSRDGTSSPLPSLFEVGDRVEVSEGYEKIGDAASGPLHPGDRGTVLEVQRGPRGDRQSVRVLYNGRRWWYQPQALLSERSGLVETPAVRFLHKLLRSHGYDHTNLQPLWGKVVTNESWEVGDFVIPVRAPCKRRKNSPVDGKGSTTDGASDSLLIGRIASEPSPSLGSPSPRGRESGIVVVDFVDPSFAIAAGLLGGSRINSSSSSVLTRRFKVRNLMHTTPFHGVSVINHDTPVNFPPEESMLEIGIIDSQDFAAEPTIETNISDAKDTGFVEDDENGDDDSEGEDREDDTLEVPAFVVNEKLKGSISSLTKLDPSAIAAVAKECSRNSASLAGMFAAGLPNAIISGIDYAQEQVEGGVVGKNKVDPTTISAFGGLAVSITKQLFDGEFSGELDGHAFRLHGLEENQTNNHQEHPTGRSQAPRSFSGGMHASAIGSTVPVNSLRPGGQTARVSPGALLLPNHHQPGRNPPVAQQVSIGDIIRDWGGVGGPSSVEQRRNVLLAVMASTRMGGDPSPSNSNSSVARSSQGNMVVPVDGDHQISSAHQRGRQTLSSFGRLSAEGAVLGYGGVGSTSTYNNRRNLPPSNQLDDIGGAMLGQRRTLDFGLAANDAGGRAASGPALMEGASTSGMFPHSVASSGSTGSNDREPNSTVGTQNNITFIESLLRGSGLVNSAACSSSLSMTRGSISRGGTGPVGASTKTLIHNGLLRNSLTWVRKTLGLKEGNCVSQSSPSPSSIDVQSIRDEDGAPPLLLAISFGCSNAILETLIRHGATVGEREIREAATTDQPLALSVLIRHSVYCEGTVDLDRCPRRVIEILNKAAERQRIEEDKMRSDSGKFVSCLLNKFIHLGVEYRMHRRGCSDHARAVSRVLVGEVLLHALHKSQHRGMMAAMNRSGQAVNSAGAVPPAAFHTEDGRIPAFATVLNAAQTGGTAVGVPSFLPSGIGSGGTVSLPSPPPSSPLCLLDALPSELIYSALTKNETGNPFGSPEVSLEDSHNEYQRDDKRDFSPLTGFLRLTESFLWSKDVRDAAVGLKLATNLLRKVPLLCARGEIERYGIKDLAMSHASLADEVLAQIEFLQSSGTDNRLHRSSPPASSGIGIDRKHSESSSTSASSAGVVLCPMKHVTVLHLTRHSSFRCDLCGKGVERGKPMHGCRDCDWDACEDCTDRAEGGIVKWGYVRDLAIECQHLIVTLQGRHEDDDEDVCSTSGNDKMEDVCSTAANDKMQHELRLMSFTDDLQKTSRGLRMRSVTALRQLASMLEVPGMITLHEFSSYVIPALHSALVDCRCRSYCRVKEEQGLVSSTVLPRRRSKKPRVGGSSRKKDDTKKLPAKVARRGSLVMSGMIGGKDEIEREAFVRAVVDVLIFDPRKRCLNKNLTSTSKMDEEVVDEVTAVEEQRISVLNMDDEEEEEEDSDDESTEEQRGSGDSRDKEMAPIVPEVIRRIHEVLAFSERATVIRNRNKMSPEGSGGGGNGGELQSLTMPFEIELRSFYRGNDRGHVNASHGHVRGHLHSLEDSAVDRKGRVIVHAEPLMSLTELQLHVLRTCRIPIPVYIRYCRRLALDKAIIAEMPAKTSCLGKNVEKNESIRRIAQVLAYDERTGAHAIRYASHFITTHGDYCDEGDEPIYGRRSLLDQLEFHGRETMLILATRDYVILNRDQSMEEENRPHFDVDSEVLMSDGMLQNSMSVDRCPPAVSSFSQMNTDTPWAMSHYNENDNVDEENFSLLPVGMRVESDIASSDGSLTVYTIISCEMSTPSNINSSCSSSGPIDVVNSAVSSNEYARYCLVSDSGEVVVGVPARKIRGHDAAVQQRRLIHQRSCGQRVSHSTQGQVSEDGDMTDASSALLRGGHQTIFDRGIPMAGVRRVTSSGSYSSDHAESGPSTPAVGVLKRTWSALSPVQNMSPLDLSISANRRSPSMDVSLSYPRLFGESSPKFLVGGNEVDVDFTVVALEKPPSLQVEFSLHATLPTTALPTTDETTLFSALHTLLMRDRSTKLYKNLALQRKCTVFYSISMHDDLRRSKVDQCVNSISRKDIPLPAHFSPPWTRNRGSDMNRPENDRYSVLRGDSCLTAAGIGHSGMVQNTFSIDHDLDFGSGMLPETNARRNLWTSLGNVENHSLIRSNPCIDNGIDISPTLPLCEGIDGTCVQCMELLCIFAQCSAESCSEETKSGEESRARNEVSNERNYTDGIMQLFESEGLTKKLLEQLDDPLTVVGGALPNWCTAAPAFAPYVFSHSSRRLLIERAAFGVSRSALRQQEAKVAVGPLRQRMAALRGRAVELVGEAFSGGAADPTALQLQADELYGMEEALAARVSAAFRAQHWEERSLQCAKAAVRRESLLTDAAAVMDHYANDERVRRRRLEVRFEGESGFDAASGDEAGVTRGFYADVAEALLSCDHVAGVLCPPICPKEVIDPVMRAGEHVSLFEQGLSLDSQQMKLPLWIPDMDSSRKVVIPTPRAGTSSGLGVYPRPLSSQHPQHAAVLHQFRFMGRLFAAALRDGFVFPLPLSASFLKLVRSGTGYYNDSRSGSRQNSSVSSSSSVQSSDYFSNNSNSLPSSVSSSPVPNSMMSIEEISNGQCSSIENTNSFSDVRNDMFIHGTFGNSSSTGATSDASKSNLEAKFSLQCSAKRRHGSQLTSLDLPRAGFLGGEVYAVEQHICFALEKLDEASAVLSREEMEKRRQEIASDRTFARKALGKSYDCSFAEFFEDRSFVDPLDPTQGENAAPLCPNGYMRSVTINNVREWVMLAKQFILHDGVIAQAQAFRRGVEDFFSADALRLFTAEELQRDVCGGGDNVDDWDESTIRSLFKLDGGKGAAEALVAVAAMGGEGGAALSRRFGPSSPTIGYLVKALLEANSTQRRQFLSFVTSVPIVTPGQIEVVPVVNPAGDFLPMSDPGCLPRANTCARRLYLPKFESYESFAQVFWAVVREESRFKGFYEWRG